MPQGLQAVLALMVLLPGFVTARIVRMMSQKTAQTELERVIEALIFSFFTYLIYLPIYFAEWGVTLPVEWTSLPQCPDAKLLNHYKQFSYSGRCFDVIIHGWGIAWIPVTAVLLGLLWGTVREKDLLLRGLRRLRMTDRSAYESVWGDVLSYIGGFIQVGIGDGREAIGLLRKYSLADGERTLLLEDAGWIGEDGKTVNVPGDGLLLLTEQAEIEFVMFLDAGQKDRLNASRQALWLNAGKGDPGTPAEQEGTKD